MNYLAHLALSHFNKEVMLGNFIGDCVKGCDYQLYSPAVRQGLLLHRQIDHFTDTHPIALQTCSLFRPAYRHYSGIICDMVYDHLLAANWHEYYPQISLSAFVSAAQRMLLLNYFRLPGKLKRILPFLIKSRRLEDYATTDGLLRALRIMSSNTSLPDHHDFLLATLTDNYPLILSQFQSFYPDLQSMTDEYLHNVSPTL